MGEIRLLDAGYSLQLQQHVEEVVEGHPLWTARFLLDNPVAVVLAHRDFIRAGSRIIRCNSYQATVDGFIKHMGLTKPQALELITKSVQLAREAITIENKVGEVMVAGSVGPYGASLHDGSEYSGTYEGSVTIEQLVAWHSEKIQTLVDAGVDILAFETIPISKEAVALLRVLASHPKIPAWISFSVKDSEHISNGERFVDAVTAVLEEAKALGIADRLIAVGVNCCKPKYVTSLLTSARAKFHNQTFIVYPNSGEHYNTQQHRWEAVEGMRRVSEYVSDWLDLGVTYVGGCCRTTDKDLPAIFQSVLKWQSSH